MRRATKVLLASSNGLDRALGAYMHDLVDKASVYGTGRSEIQQAKRRDLRIKDPEVLGGFRIAIESPGFDELVSAYAHQ